MVNGRNHENKIRKKESQIKFDSLFIHILSVEIRYRDSIEII